VLYLKAAWAARLFSPCRRERTRNRARIYAVVPFGVRFRTRRHGSEALGVPLRPQAAIPVFNRMPCVNSVIPCSIGLTAQLANNFRTNAIAIGLKPRCKSVG
jgi:hypothetical protein